MENPDRCPVCRGTLHKITPSRDSGQSILIDCAICGKFFLGAMAMLELDSAPEPHHLLSGWIRWIELRAGRPPKILQSNLETIRRALPTFSTSAKTTELLKALALLSSSPGNELTGSLSTDFPLAWARNTHELEFHLKTLTKKGFLEFELIDMDSNYSACLTGEGWDYIEQGPAFVIPRAFVAMSFSDAMFPSWTDGLRIGIERAGYAAHRVDSELHADHIDQKVISDIRLSRFIVADVTEQKSGVYFEAGLGLGLGKPVIWTVRDDDYVNVHFDTRQFAHIKWSNPTELAHALTDVIVGVIGPGPNYGR